MSMQPYKPGLFPNSEILEIKYKACLCPQCIQIYVLYYLVFQYWVQYA